MWNDNNQNNDLNNLMLGMYFGNMINQRRQTNEIKNEIRRAAMTPEERKKDDDAQGWGGLILLIIIGIVLFYIFH